MQNIIKSQLYSISRDVYTYICLMLTIFMCVLATFMLIDETGGEDITGSLMLANSEMYSLISLFSALMFSTRICGWDINDKTINFEVLYGHKRSIIYWSRAIVSVVVGAALSFVVNVAPVLICLIKNGWGNAIPISELYPRIAVLLFAYIRISALYVILTIVTKSSWGSLVIGYVLLFAEAILSVLSEKITYILTISNISKILEFNNRYPGYIDGEDVTMFKDRIATGFITGSVTFSLIITVVSLIGGYLIFKKRDLD